MMSLKSTHSFTDDADRENAIDPLDETIFALSSGNGPSASAVAVIRLTGSQAHYALQILLSKSQRPRYDDVKLPPPRYAALRMLHDPIRTEEVGISRDPLDSSLVLLFDRPKSFTGEDMVEIHCHGGRGVINGMMDALSRLSKAPYNLNIRPADRGEFTQRAYGNGKLGLVEVEALADLIVADTSYQRLQALRQLDGRLSELYEGWRQELIKGLAHAEAVIDFGDDEDLDDEPLDSLSYGRSGEMNVWGAIRPNMQNLMMKMERHLADAQRGELLRDGVKVAIVGPPNAGKSSLLNLLANRDAAIVSPIAGTTRDIVEVTLDLGGVRCIVSDTAGVREDGSTEDVIEIEGIKRARKAAAEANILICMVDSTDQDQGINAVNDVLKNISFNNEQKVLFIRNKADLIYEKDVTTSKQSLLPAFPIDTEYSISCTTNDGVDDFIGTLTRKVLSRVNLDDTNRSDYRSTANDEGAVITRARHRRHVESAASALERFYERSGEGYMSLDLAAEELRLAASELGRITGAIDVEDVLDVLFSDFCIGK